jgi:choline monooxygenase
MKRDRSAQFSIDAEITRASTPPAAVYHDPVAYEVQREQVFARSWQLVEHAGRVRAPGHVLPFTMLPGCLDEPETRAAGCTACRTSAPTGAPW